jgi:hypothetical protein
MAWIWPQNPRRANPKGTLCTAFTDGTLSAMPLSNTMLMIQVQVGQSPRPGQEKQRGMSVG